MEYAIISGSDTLEGKTISYLTDDDQPSARIAYDANENGYDHDEDDESDSTHASRWLNSARVSVAGDEVHASISVGDPRGAFVMTIRMHPDGYLIMHVPTPNDSTLHQPLTEIRPGTYRIG